VPKIVRRHELFRIRFYYRELKEVELTWSPREFGEPGSGNF